MSDDFEKLLKDKELTKSIRDLTIGLSKFLTRFTHKNLEFIYCVKAIFAIVLSVAFGN